MECRLFWRGLHGRSRNSKFIMAPENDRERLIVGNIDSKGQAVLDGYVPWSEHMLFTADRTPTDRERTLIDERLQYWERRIVEANGRAEPSAHLGAGV